MIKHLCELLNQPAVLRGFPFAVPLLSPPLRSPFYDCLPGPHLSQTLHRETIKGNVGEKKIYENFVFSSWRDACRHAEGSVYTWGLQLPGAHSPRVVIR